MSQAVIAKPCAMDAGLAVRRASEHLTQRGYELVKHRDDGTAELKYVRGSVSKVRLEDYPHRLEVSSNGEELTFIFTAGLAGGGYVTKGEREAVEQRAAEAARAALAAKPKPARVSCRQCGQLTSTSVATCEKCGSEDYY